MQTASDKEPEAMATCPYNPAHRFPLFRMKRHLVKCKMNNPIQNDVMMICPLNNEHRIPQPEYRFHLEVCPNRVDLDRKVQVPERIDRYYPVIVPEVADLSNDECWDDASHPTYDPTKHVTEQPILRIQNCNSKARRIEFRMEERNRIGRIMEENQHLTKPVQQIQLRESLRTATDAPVRRPVTRPVAATNAKKKNLDPYKVNDMLQALNSDQKKLLDNLENMGAEETSTAFPIAGGSVKKEAEAKEILVDEQFPSLGGAVGESSSDTVPTVGRDGGYAASLARGRGRRHRINN